MSMASEADVSGGLVHGDEGSKSITADEGLPTAPTVLEGKTPSRRRIVFLGNCQLGMLASLYRSLLPPDATEEISYVASYSQATEAQKQLVATANILVQQVLDFVPRIGDLPTRAKVHLVPHVTAAFLWPYSGEAHPRNIPEPMLDPGGPYPPDLGDSFLNRMIAAGVAPDEAVARYLDTDVPRVRRVDRVMELVLEKQRNRDRSCGYAFADLIEAEFRSTCLFRSPNHPETSTAIRFAAEVFGRVDVDPRALERLMIAPPQHLFPPSETPIHPALVAHFGLTYAQPDRRYRYFSEGGFTFEEYARRYMHYEWNALLAEGLHLLRTGATEVAIERLQAAMPSAPRAANARIILADALERIGRLTEAVTYAREATSIEPTNVRYAQRLTEISHALSRRETQRGSATAVSITTRSMPEERRDGSLKPAHASEAVHSVLAGQQSTLDDGLAAAQAARNRGDIKTALNLYLRLSDKFPGSALPLRRAATMLLDAGRLDEAEALLERDGMLRTTDAGVAIDYASIAQRRGDFKAAKQRWQFVQTQHPDHSGGWTGYVASLREGGDLDTAEAILDTALARFPSDAGLAVEHGWVAMRRRDFAAAAERWRYVRETFPAHAPAYVAEARAHIEAGRYAEAELLLPSAIRKFPDNPALLVEFARAATGRRDWTGALERWRSVRDAIPGHVGAYRSEATALSELQRDDEAEAVLALAVSLFPNNPGILIDRARMAQRRRDFTEALLRWTTVRARHPDDPDGYVGEVGALREIGWLDAAEALVRAAMRRFPLQANLWTAYCDIAADRQDWRTASLRTQESLLRFPDDRRFVQRDFEMRMRLAESQQDFDETNAAQVQGPAIRSTRTDSHSAQRDLMMRFESLGGCGHGCEFGLVQRHFGAEPLSLLRWADLSHESLTEALDSHFSGVGSRENTVVFSSSGDDEWWTRDTRYHMAMRCVAKVEHVSHEQMTVQACRRIQFLRRKLLADLAAGDKIFVFKNLFRNLSNVELTRLWLAIRAYGRNKLLYVRYADAEHPNGTVEATEDGLWIGYIERFAFAPNDEPLGPATDLWFQLCATLNEKLDLVTG
jgi:tetratricopeptide (TPR) repeat protein